MKYYIYKSYNKVNNFVLDKGKTHRLSLEFGINTPVYVATNIETMQDPFEKKLAEIKQELDKRSLLGEIYERNMFYKGTIETQPFRIGNKSDYVYAVNTQEFEGNVYLTVLVGSYENVTYGYAIDNIAGMFEMKTKNLQWKEEAFISDIISICEIGIENRFKIEYIGECIYNNEYELESFISEKSIKGNNNSKKIILKVITPFYMRVVR